MSSGPDHERAGLEEEISEPPRGKREKADPGSPPLPAWLTWLTLMTGSQYDRQGSEHDDR